MGPIQGQEEVKKKVFENDIHKYLDKFDNLHEHLYQDGLEFAKTLKDM